MLFRGKINLKNSRSTRSGSSTNSAVIYPNRFCERKSFRGKSEDISVLRPNTLAAENRKEQYYSNHPKALSSKEGVRGKIQ